MMWSLAALVIGFCIDLLVGDPHGFPHPVVQYTIHHHYILMRKTMPKF